MEALKASLALGKKPVRSVVQIDQPAAQENSAKPKRSKKTASGD
jgi:hypothetical protein